MRKHEWILRVCNTLSNICDDCDSPTTIEGSRLSEYDRYKIQKTLKDLIEYIEDRLFDE